MKNLCFILVFMLWGSLIILAQKKNKKSVNSLNDNPTETYLNMNNISSVFSNDGTSDIKSNGDAGFIYPKGSGKTAIYQSGLVYGASVPYSTTLIELGGTVYNSGLQPGWMEKFNSVFAFDTLTCWAAGTGGIILKTTNGGLTWNKQFTHVNNNLHSIYFTDPNTGWAVGNGGIILKSTDGGIHWISQSSPTKDSLFSVQFINKNLGWAVGSGGVILHTSNGNDWSIQPDQNTNSLNSVYFISKDTGSAVGSNGTILYTVNGGDYWGKIKSITDTNLYSIYITSSEKAYAVGEGGTVIQITTDSTWNSTFKFYNTLNSLFFIGPDSGWAVGNYGTILNTTNGGESGEVQTSNTLSNLYSVHFVNSKYGWAAGGLGTILRTTDGGENWVNKIPTRIFRVRPDVYPGGPQVDLSAEAADEGLTQQEIRSQYEADWEQWPAYMGAPFQDKNHDGIYEPDVDVPGVTGAPQTIWFVANDDNDNFNFYQSPPMGMEYEATIWEYTDSTGFNNFLFRKYKLINQSNNYKLTNSYNYKGKPQTWQNMYVSIWSDIDIGNATDDFAGCDTTLNLGFGYNGEDADAQYSPLPPPAVGFKLIRGPFVQGKPGEDLNRNGIDDQNDYGLNSNNVRVKGYINLPMTAFYYFSQMFPPPSIGTYNGTLQFYNYLQGKDISGSEFKDPVTNSSTTFALSGDPVQGTGWVDGISEPSGDRQIGISTGPFQMAPGDTQVVVFAQIAAGAENGVSRLNAVDSLKYYSKIAQQFYDANKVTSVNDNSRQEIPLRFSLKQNYPNPFNPTTTIKYDIPKAEHVILKVYDILGREVETLVNKEQQAGNYDVQFAIGSRQLASGVYLYRLQAGSFVQVRKMILLK